MCKFGYNCNGFGLWKTFFLKFLLTKRSPESAELCIRCQNFWYGEGGWLYHFVNHMNHAAGCMMVLRNGLYMVMTISGTVLRGWAD
jgi:hypothetical protein